MSSTIKNKIMIARYTLLGAVLWLSVYAWVLAMISWGGN